MTTNIDKILEELNKTKPDISSVSPGITFSGRDVVIIIMMVITMITSVVSLLKPQDETAVQNSYETLSKQLKITSDDIAKNHDDIEALRNFLDGYIKARREEPMKAQLQTQPRFGISKVLADPVKQAEPVTVPYAGPRPQTWAPPPFKSQMTEKQ